MQSASCPYCGGDLSPQRHAGDFRVYCSPKCQGKAKAFNERQIAKYGPPAAPDGTCPRCRHSRVDFVERVLIKYPSPTNLMARAAGGFRCRKCGQLFRSGVVF